MKFDEFTLRNVMDEIVQPAAAQMSGEHDVVSVIDNELMVSEQTTLWSCELDQN